MTLVPVAELDETARQQVQAIYEDAFEARLRAPLEDLLRDDMSVLLDDEAQPLGFAVVRALGSTGWVFLRYLAVGSRGQGLGSTLWARLAEAMSAAGHTRIIWDVEDPTEPGIEETEARLHRRRIAFYGRLGGQVLPVREYVMPHNGQSLPLLLMTADLTVRPAPATGPVMAGPELRELVLAVYRYRYLLDEADPVVQGVLRASGLAADHP